MLGVEEHLVHARPEERDRLADHREILGERRLERLGHVEVPRLADDRGYWSTGVEQGLHVRVGLRRGPGAAGHAECRELGLLERNVLHPAEESKVFWIRARPSALDVMDPQRVEPGREAHLIFHRKRHAFALRAVAERRVVDLDQSAHGGPRSCARRGRGVNTRGARAGADESGIETRREAGADRGPLGVEDREIDRVALIAAHVHVLAQRALADGAQSRDRVLRADVAPVGLERDPHAAERLEAVPQEEQLRFGVGRRAPVVPPEERRADLDLPVGRPHVEQTRRADRAPGRLPDLREDDRLPAGHQRLRLANETERLVECLRRGPREVAAHLRVLHHLEQIARVPLGERLQHDVAPLEGDRDERRQRVRHPGRQTAPWARRRSIADFLSPTSVFSTASVCWPMTGGGVTADPGVAWSRTGTPITVTFFALGWGSDTIMPRALRCSLSQTSATDLMRPAGMPAPSNCLTHSAAARVPRISFSSGTSVSRFWTRLASVSKRGSVASSGRPRAAQHLIHRELLATPSTTNASAARNTS